MFFSYEYYSLRCADNALSCIWSMMFMKAGHSNSIKIAYLCLILFVLSAPSLSSAGLILTKSCNVKSAYLGDIVVYAFNLENNGSESLSDLAILDDHLGRIALNRSTLKAHESCIASISYQIAPSDIPGPLVNTARGSARCQSGEIFSNNASFAVNLGVYGDENISKYELLAGQSMNRPS